MAGYGSGPYGSGPYGGTQPAPPSGPVGTYQGIVSGNITATTTGVTLPPDRIPPAPGRHGLMTVVNTGAVAVTLTAPGSGPFLLPPGKAIAVFLPPGRFVASTNSGSAVVSYLYAGS
jgi:hypothetical protein